MIGKWISFSSLSFSSVTKKKSNSQGFGFFPEVCVIREQQIWCCIKTEKKPRKPKRNMEKKVQISNNKPGSWSRTRYLLTVWPAPANCHSTFCMGNLQEKKPRMQNTTMPSFKDVSHQQRWNAKMMETRPEHDTKEKEITSSFMWHHPLWPNWMSLVIHLNLQGGRSNNPAGQSSGSAFSQLPLKIPTDTQPLSTGQRWQNNLVMITGRSTIGCISAALGKERILAAFSVWHHHTHYQQ